MRFREKTAVIKHDDCFFRKNSIILEADYNIISMFSDETEQKAQWHGSFSAASEKMQEKLDILLDNQKDFTKDIIQLDFSLLNSFVPTPVHFFVQLRVISNQSSDKCYSSPKTFVPFCFSLEVNSPKILL